MCTYGFYSKYICLKIVLYIVQTLKSRTTTEKIIIKNKIIPQPIEKLKANFSKKPAKKSLVQWREN